MRWKPAGSLECLSSTRLPEASLPAAAVPNLKNILGTLSWFPSVSAPPRTRQIVVRIPPSWNVSVFFCYFFRADNIIYRKLLVLPPTGCLHNMLGQTSTLFPGFIADVNKGFSISGHSFLRRGTDCTGTEEPFYEEWPEGILLSTLPWNYHHLELGIESSCPYTASPLSPHSPAGFILGVVKGWQDHIGTWKPSF